MRTKDGDTLVVHYTGYLYKNCTDVFESSRVPVNRPHTFLLGADPPEVILGWERTMRGWCVGEHRKITVPANHAYGPQGNHVIPPGAALIFEAELMGIGERPIKHKVRRSKSRDRVGYTKGLNTEELNQMAPPPEEKDL